MDEKIVFLFDRYDEVYGYRRIADELISEFGIVNVNMKMYIPANVNMYNLTCHFL